ncbi:hypothetical protein M422DRAFT_276825 [Sphaerobolus stellatus SS14]|uniref:Uncharacterized protein n=1 Tax=Sphaerobolus stellatus (strain SS14) TaxID=990650 RepID=A0A0C9UB10_SPHS4|nr:hypothetical protein M422DRAFT_276825 [Sphaerobolus stellatus SS14]
MDESGRKYYKQINQMWNRAQHKVIEQWVYAYLESEEETEEVKVKRRKAKGKGKAIDTEYK